MDYLADDLVLFGRCKLEPNGLDCNCGKSIRNGLEQSEFPPVKGSAIRFAPDVTEK